MHHEHITKNELTSDRTISLFDLINKPVLSIGATFIGKVSDIRLNPQDHSLEGITIKGTPLNKSIYVGVSYIKNISSQAILLNVEISLLIKGRKVLTSDGKLIGKVSKIIRKGTTNEIDEIIISYLLHKDLHIPSKHIKKIGPTIILDSHAHVKTKYIWQFKK